MLLLQLMPHSDYHYSVSFGKRKLHLPAWHVPFGCIFLSTCWGVWFGLQNRPLSHLPRYWYSPPHASPSVLAHTGQQLQIPRVIPPLHFSLRARFGVQWILSHGGHWRSNEAPTDWALSLASARRTKDGAWSPPGFKQRSTARPGRRDNTRWKFMVMMGLIILYG